MRELEKNKMRKTRIFVSDNISYCREGLKIVLRDEEEYKVAGMSRCAIQRGLVNLNLNLLVK